MRLVRPALLGLTLIASAACVHAYVQDQAQTRAELQANSDDIVEGLAAALDTYFLFPEIGSRYAAALRANLRSGRYGSVASPQGLAETVTADLQAIYPDGHLRLRVVPRREPPAQSANANAPDESPETGIERSAWIAPQIAYIGFELFPGTETSLNALRRELDRFAGARTLIIDARTHGGGYTEEVDLLASYLFGRETLLAYTETRAAADRGSPDTGTLRRVNAPAGLVRKANIAQPGPDTALRRAQVFVLTSAYTGSAAEYLALVLKRTRRATLIGEITGGAGHYGRIVDLPAGFSAFVPIGRAFDPDTGEGWEGVGVAPDVAVSADDALTEALVRSAVPRASAQAISQSIRLRGTMERQVPLRRPPPRN